MKSTPFQLPQFSKLRIKSIFKQLNAHRREGIRIQHQLINNKHIIHNYGQSLSTYDMAYGSAFIAIKAMMIKIDNNNAANVAVLGDNINGIMTAIELVKRGFKIKLYSENQWKLLNMSEQVQRSAPRGFSLWFPDGYDWQEDLLKHQLLSKYSYDFLAQCKRLHKYRSVHETSVIQFNKPKEQLRQCVSDLVFDNYHPINLTYPNGQQEEVVEFSTIIIDNSLHLEQLKTELVLRGGRFVTKKLATLDDVLSIQETIAINCLAPESKKIFNDQKIDNRQSIIVDFEVKQEKEDKELNVRLFIDQDNFYEIIYRNATLKVKLPPKPLSESEQSWIQKHLFKIDAFFNTRRSQAAKL